MGFVLVQVRIANPFRTELYRDIPDALVDTGASWTTIPRLMAEELALPSFGLMTAQTAAGTVTLVQSSAYIEMANKRGITPVAISERVDRVLIGVLTLEALLLMVDPVNGVLKETEFLLL
jgi:predicted aspartyl protease